MFKLPRMAAKGRHLPEELQDEILVRLPAKSLIRFELVSKTWRSKFHSRPFINMYGIRGPHDDDSEYSLDFYTAPGRKFDLMKTIPGLKRLPSPKTATGGCWKHMTCVFGPLSNGIFCLTSHWREDSRDHTSILSGKIALCNPCIRDCNIASIFLPPDLYPLASDNFASKPCRAHFGFGKVSSSCSGYKIVLLIESSSCFIGLAYSVRRREWKRIVGGTRLTEPLIIQGRRIINVCYPLELRPQRFLEGCWHWIAIGEDESFMVLSFNFAAEVFKLMGGPPLTPYVDLLTKVLRRQKASVFVLDNHLAVIYLHIEVLLLQCVEVDVWMMMEYGVEESWTMIYKINPNFCGDLRRLVGIKYHRPLRERDEEEESGSIHIKSLSFQDHKDRIVCCDDAGYQVRGPLDSITTPEFSTYIETLERL